MFPGLRHICYEGSFFLFSMQCLGSFMAKFVRKPFAMFVGKPFPRCLQCLSESLSLVRPETGTGEVVAGPLGSASAFN